MIDDMGNHHHDHMGKARRLSSRFAPMGDTTLMAASAASCSTLSSRWRSSMWIAASRAKARHFLSSSHAINYYWTVANCSWTPKKRSNKDCHTLKTSIAWNA